MEKVLPHPYEVLKEVQDPEIPVLSVVDLGMIRDVEVRNNTVKISLSPTYNGCPALDVIRMNIRVELMLAGYKKVTIKDVLSPPWTTDWISEEGKAKLKEYGISPPVGKSDDNKNEEEKVVPCPHCLSSNTEMVSFFGSTACKAMYKCKDCLEPFDYFKCH